MTARIQYTRAEQIDVQSCTFKFFEILFHKINGKTQDISA